MRHPLDRTLAVSAGLLGVLAFVLALVLSKSQQVGWALPVGIVALVAGLTTASLLGLPRPRGRRR